MCTGGVREELCRHGQNRAEVAGLYHGVMYRCVRKIVADLRQELYRAVVLLPIRCDLEQLLSAVRLLLRLCCRFAQLLSAVLYRRVSGTPGLLGALMKLLRALF